MSSALSSSISIVAYIALFASIGLVFLFANLLVGWFVRPKDPHEEKLEIYECGEPTIGSSFVQFDLRFYVVALLFIIFDVEVAFFFPWAAVFGKATHLMDSQTEIQVVSEEGELTDPARYLYQEMGVRNPTVPTQVPASLKSTLGETADATQIIREGARQLVLVTIVDIAVFFAVLMIGFAYVWRRGDLDWVRAVSRQKQPTSTRAGPTLHTPQESVLSA